MEMLLNGTPSWTHITRDGRKAIIITDQIDVPPYAVLAVVESNEAPEKYKTVYLDRSLMFYADGEESPFDLRPFDPFEDVKPDTPVWVRQVGGQWQRRHFAFVDAGKVYAWADGKTSFTETLASPWNEYSLTDPEEDDL